jgi:hypothetical protein
VFPGKPRKDFTMNKSIPFLAAAIACLVAGAVAAPAMARGGGSFGDGGRMSGTMSSGEMSPGDMSFRGMASPATHMPSAQEPTASPSSGMRSPDTGSNSSNVFQSLDNPIPGLANTPSPP